MHSLVDDSELHRFNGAPCLSSTVLATGSARTVERFSFCFDDNRSHHAAVDLLECAHNEYAAYWLCLALSDYVFAVSDYFFCMTECNATALTDYAYALAGYALALSGYVFVLCRVMAVFFAIVVAIAKLAT